MNGEWKETNGRDCKEVMQKQKKNYQAVKDKRRLYSHSNDCGTGQRRKLKEKRSKHKG